MKLIFFFKTSVFEDTRLEKYLSIFLVIFRRELLFQKRQNTPQVLKTEENISFHSNDKEFKLTIDYSAFIFQFNFLIYYIKKKY